MKKQVKLLLTLVAAGAGIWTAFAFNGGPKDYYYTLTTGAGFYELNPSYTANQCDPTGSSTYCEYSCSSDIGTYTTGWELQTLGATGYYWGSRYIY